MKSFIQHHATTIRYVESVREMTHNIEIHCLSVPETCSKNLLDMIVYCKEVLKDGHRVCGLVQKRIQIETGLASIRESQKSIEEAVSVKRLGQLAFIFIPLTYASSLFGMNIKEMNGSGPKLWTFLLSSVCISGITLALWNSVKPVRSWIQSHRGEPMFSFGYYVLHGAIGLRFGLFW